MTEKKLPHAHGHISLRLQEKVPGGEGFGMVADVFKLLSDAKRLQLFWLLCHCEECVVNLAALLELSSPAVSHHLKLLKTAGLILSRREGKEVYYTAAKTLWSQALHEMIEQSLEMACPGEEHPEESGEYDSQIQTVHAVHQLLSEDLKGRYTTEELAARFHMNPTTLKTVFKTVYGQPIAAHRKEHRIEKARELLCHSGLSIAEIAREVGYENQSKFTQAFKDSTGLLPKDYRKQCQGK